MKVLQYIFYEVNFAILRKPFDNETIITITFGPLINPSIKLINGSFNAIIKINIKNMYIIVGVVYRKPGSNLEEFSDDLNRLLQNMNLDRSPCIIVGDLNINLLSQHDKSKDFLRMTESYGLRQLITDPTRVTNTTSSLIDHIYTNISSHNIQSGCIVVEISDHFPVFAIFENLNCVEVKKKRITRRNFRNFSLDSFLTDLRNKQWLNVSVEEKI